MDRSKLSSNKYLLLGALIVILIVLGTLPLYTSPYSAILITSIFMYIVMTLSWAMFSGPTGYISLATAAFFGVGIYTSALLGNVLPLPVVICIGGLVSFCLALLIGALTLRLRGIYFTIFTFGLLELGKHILLWWEMSITGTRGRFVVTMDPITVYYVMLVILLALLLTAYFIRRSKVGLALRSIGDCEEAAAHTGVNVDFVKTLIFAVSAIFIGATGAIMATRWTYIDPYIAFNPLFSFFPVLMAIFGGTGQLYGPILGATVFSYLEETLITSFPYHYMLLFGIILVISVLYLPDGLVGIMQNVSERIRGRK